MLQSIAYDKFIEFYCMFYYPDSTKESIAEKSLVNLQQMSTYLGSKDFLAGGDIPSIADFLVFEHIEYANLISENQVFQRYPTLRDFHGRMASLPSLKRYRAGPAFEQFRNKYTAAFVNVKINPTTPGYRAFALKMKKTALILLIS